MSTLSFYPVSVLTQLTWTPSAAVIDWLASRSYLPLLPSEHMIASGNSEIWQSLFTKSFL